MFHVTEVLVSFLETTLHAFLLVTTLLTNNLKKGDTIRRSHLNLILLVCHKYGMNVDVETDSVLCLPACGINQGHDGSLGGMKEPI